MSAIETEEQIKEQTEVVSFSNTDTQAQTQAQAQTQSQIQVYTTAVPSNKVFYIFHKRQLNSTSDGYLTLIPQQGTNVIYKRQQLAGEKRAWFSNVLGINQLPFIIPSGTYSFKAFTKVDGVPGGDWPYQVGFSLTHIYADNGEPNQGNKYITGKSLNSSQACYLVGFGFIPHDPLLVGKKLTFSDGSVFTISDNDIVNNKDKLNGTWSNPNNFPGIGLSYPNIPDISYADPNVSGFNFTSDINSATIVPYTMSDVMKNPNPQWVTVNYTVPNNITSFGNADWLSLTVWASTSQSPFISVYYGDGYPITLSVPF